MPRSFPLTGVADGPSHRMMFDRAKEHLERFNGAVTSWRTDSAHGVFEEVDADIHRSWGPRRWPPGDGDIGGNLVFHENYGISSDWALVLSEAIRGFRCSLDHLAYALACSFTGESLPDDVASDSEFPIFGKSVPSAKTLTKKIGGINPDAQTIIKCLQPHKAADYKKCPLWVLYELDRRSKHRIIPIIGRVPTAAGIAPGHNIDRTWSEHRIGTVEEGTVMDRFVFTPIDPDADMQVNFQLSFDVALGEGFPSLGSATETMGRIRDTLERDIFPPLEPFLR